MIIAGADPGGRGALALLDAETKRVLAIIDMELAGAELMVRQLVLDIEGTLDGRRVGSIYIERQAPFLTGTKAGKGHVIGATSAFNIGQRYMAIKAIAACFGWPTEIISPRDWQKYFGIKKADKALSKATADRLMPLDAGLWAVRRGYCNKEQSIGRCEAALIALFGARMLAGLNAAAGWSYQDAAE